MGLDRLRQRQRGQGPRHLHRAIAALILLLATATAQDSPVGNFVAALHQLHLATTPEARQAAGDALYSQVVRDQRALAEQRAAVLAAVAEVRKAAAAQGVVARVFYERETAFRLVDLGQQAAALANLQEFLAAVPEPDDGEPAARRYYASGLVMLAELQHATSDRKSARATARRAQILAIGPDPGLMNIRADAFGVETRIAIDEGRLDIAYETLAQELALVGQLTGKGLTLETLARSCVFEAEFYIQQDRYRPALKALERYGKSLPQQLATKHLATRLALAESEQHGDQQAEAELRRFIADHTLETGFLTAARIMLLRAAILRGDYVAAQADLDSLRQLHAADARGNGQMAQIEMLASRLLRMQCAEAPASTTAAADLREQLRHLRGAFEQLLSEWQQSAVEPGGLGFLARAYRCQILTELVRLTIAVEGPEVAARTAIADLLCTQRLTSTARELGVGETSLADVRAVFTDRQSGVLVLIAEPNGSLLLAFDDHQQQVIALPGRHEMATDVAELKLALGAASTVTDGEARAQAGEQLLARARKASGKLLTPAVKQLLQGWTQLTVADYGMLGGLPWECLELSPGVLLGEQIAVNTLTSLPLGVMLKRDRYRPGPAAKARIHLVATLSGSPLLIDAKAKVVRSIDRDSVMRLAKPYSGHDELLNGEATLERVASTSFGDQVTHFLTHGAQRGAERPAGLALSPARRDDDGFFGSDAAEKLAVSGLVVISACGAGRGHPRVGDEVLHATLGGAFLRAGAHTIVQTSADLHLHAHLRLMELVHAMIADATAPAVALRDARARIARSADLVERFEHAQVQVFGLGHLPVVVR